MTAVRYVPIVEHLEGKLLLAVAPILHDMDAIPSSVESVESTPENHIKDIAVSTQYHPEGGALLVQLDPSVGPCTVCIVGGDAAVTDEAGSARLHLPSNAQLVDLTIHDLRGKLVGSVRLEIDAEGEIVHETWQEDESDDEEHSEYVVALNHPDVLHAMNVPISQQNLESVEHGHADMRAEGQVDSGAVDVAIAHHDVNPGGSNDTSPPASGHFSRGHGVPSAPSEPGESADNVSAEHTAMAAETGSAAESNAIHVEIPADEDIDTILANWTSAEEPPADLMADGGTVEPAIVVRAQDASPHEPHEIAPVVFAAYFPTLPVAPSVDEAADETTQWPMIGGVAISVLAAGAAIALDRKANADASFTAQPQALAPAR